MQFIMIAIGIVLIFIALKLNTKKKEADIVEKFDNLVENKIKDESDMKLSFIMDQIKELNLRFENVEDSILLLSAKIDEIQKVKFSDAPTKNEEVNKPNIVVEEKNEEELLDLNDLIYKLNEQGYSVDDISSKLNIGKGEVLLRLGLKKAKV
ncbi:hypothetical protein ABG79_01231 [Caloramator mitchellensis]|uniref:Uncharacterized protein n=1 Tax=Caloramator mitchellensis TaxID=908809 RepID=A0A0R3K0K5_CALMK|nr:hypothetical protein [Caloramator mitchellensis]KRQ87038.1 hypothetical protein ABG79_01231 [Caloramator mitchellensis]